MTWQTCLSCIMTLLLVMGMTPGKGEATPFAGFDWTLNRDAALVGSDLRLTPAAYAQWGTAFISTPFPIDAATSFDALFRFKLAGGAGADGLVFVVQNDSRGATALGYDGGWFGYGGFEKGASPFGPGQFEKIIPSIAVEFDTFWNPWDTSANQVGVDDNSTVANMTSLVTANPSFSLRGSDRYAWVEYNGPTNGLAVFLSTTPAKPSSALLSYSFTSNLDALLGPQAYFGFGAGTGGLWDNQDIREFTLTVSPLSEVPEPGTLLLLGSGLVGFAAAWRKRLRARSVDTREP